MGQYKVPQDVEAEDHILGQLTVKQFIYSVIGVVWAGLSFVIFKSVPPVMIVVGAPPTIIFLLLGLYKKDGQDFEHLLVAASSFFAQSRRRIWRKEPVLEVFKITPPKIVKEQTQRDPAEVRSELEHIAAMVDSRGGLGQNPALQEGVFVPGAAATGVDDRLVAPIAPAVTQPITDITESDDILDFSHNAGAQNVANLVQQSTDQQRQEAIEQMRAQAADLALGKTPSSTENKKATTTSVMTPPVANDIIRLATENDDLTVSRIAAQADRVQTLSEGQSVTINNASGQ